MFSAALLALPFPAHAQAIHPLWMAGALSPLVVLLLIVLLGWLARSIRLGLVHAILIIAWVVLFWLASTHVTNDYLIWAPLAVYLLHSAVIVALVLWHAVDRRRPKGRVA
jgi:hypothetical protein